MQESIPPSSTPDSGDAKPARPRRLRLTNWQIILIALIIVGGRLVIDFSQRIVEGQQKVSDQRTLEAEIATLEQDHKQLEADKTYYGSEAYVEAWAHDQGKMVRDGEVLVVPLYSRPTPAAGATATEAAPESQRTQATIPAWRVWWTLFFDSQPPFPTSR